MYVRVMERFFSQIEISSKFYCNSRLIFVLTIENDKFYFEIYMLTNK